MNEGFKRRKEDLPIDTRKGRRIMTDAYSLKKSLQKLPELIEDYEKKELSKLTQKVEKNSPGEVVDLKISEKDNEDNMDGTKSSEAVKGSVEIL